MINEGKTGDRGNDGKENIDDDEKDNDRQKRLKSYIIFKLAGSDGGQTTSHRVVLIR